MLYEAKKQGLIIKLRHAKVLICGPSKAGKSSFCRLLRNKEHEDKCKNTLVADAKQLLVSVKVNVTHTNWKDLDSNLEIQQLRKRYMHNYKLSKKPNSGYDSLGNSYYKSHSKVVGGVTKSELNESILDINSSSDTHLKDALLLAEMKITSDTDIQEPMFNSLASSQTASEVWDLPEVWDILTILDTGGQPEIINLLPTINASTAVADLGGVPRVPWNPLLVSVMIEGYGSLAFNKPN